jgi:hypothetical protein
VLQREREKKSLQNVTKTHFSVPLFLQAETVLFIISDKKAEQRCSVCFLALILNKRSKTENGQKTGKEKRTLDKMLVRLRSKEGQGEKN